MTYYKFLTATGTSTYAGHSWPLPTDTEPSTWVEVEGDLVACSVGLHACTAYQRIEWLDAQLYTLEFDGEVIGAGNKVYGRRARLVSRVDVWNERTARTFAADCAERVSHLWVAPEGCEWQPSDTIDVARRYVEGDASADELDAAGDAAWDAAWDAWAARDAAGAAWAARDAARAAAGAAWAARDAAWDAAGAAAGAAARAAGDAERKWQSQRLAQLLGEVAS